MLGFSLAAFLKNHNSIKTEPQGEIPANSPVEQAILIDMRDDNVTQANVLLEVSVMRNTTSHTDDEDVIDFLEGAQEPGSCVTRSSHCFACATDRW